MPINKATLEYRKNNNLCPRDGKPNAPGKKLCERCLARSAAKTERYREKKIQAGLCANCGKNSPIVGSQLCLKCKEQASIHYHNAHIKRYGNRKQTGLCVDCGFPAESNKTMCSTCLQRRSKNQKNKTDTFIANSLCSQCGKNQPIENGKRCQTCIDKRNEWYQGSSTQAKDKIRRDKNRELVIQHYGSKCMCCGEVELAFLAIDHINDGEGNSHRKKINKWGSTFNKWLVDNNFPEGFQVLCHNCNMGKHLNGGICPHQIRS